MTATESAALAGGEFVFILAVIVVMVVLLQRGRRLTRELGLPKGQRARPMALEFTEPVLEIIIIGAILWSDLSTDAWHALAGLVGILPGVLLGRYRAEVMFVRAVPDRKAVIFRRSGAEFLALGLLIVVKLVGEGTEQMALPDWMSFVITGALTMIIAESFTRVAITYRWYVRARSEESAA